MEATNLNNSRKFSPIHHTGHFFLLMVGVNLLLVGLIISYFSLTVSARQEEKLKITNSCIEDCLRDKELISTDDFCDFHCSLFGDPRAEAVKIFLIVVILAMLNFAALSLYGGLVRLFYNRKSGTVLVILGFILFLFFFAASSII